MGIINTWVRYFDRSFDQITNSLFVRLAAKTPEITDFSPNNPYVRDVTMVAAMSEMLGYYIDNAGREAYVASARLYASLVNLAKNCDYRIIGNRPHSTNITFTINTTGITDTFIPAGSIVTTEDGIPFVTQEDATIIAGQTTSNSVSVMQYEEVTAVAAGTSTGLANQEIAFTEKIAHDSIAVRVDGDTWFPQTTLAFSTPEDEHFVQTVNEIGQVVIYFGNANPTGAIPGAGLAYEVDYKLTYGEDGYAAAGDINTVVTTISLPAGVTTLSVTNPLATSGGGNVETVDDLKRHIPVANRLLLRAVTAADYGNMAAQVAGVAKAKATVINKTVTLYVVPDGGGIASSALLNDVITELSDNDMITTSLDARSAGEVHIKIAASVTALANYYNSSVKSAVETAITGWLNYNFQDISGKVVISDIYQRIENTTGVSNSVITIFHAIPYPRPVNATAPQLNWAVALLSGSTVTVKWTIVFVTTSTFRLVKNSVVVGTYSTAALVSVTEVEFTVAAGGHAVGDTYEFYTYPYSSNTIQLTETSLPVSVLADLTINVTGGL